MQKTTAYSLSDWLGYLSRGEVDFIKKLATDIKARNPVIVNIGAGAGTSGLAFREARPDADLYTVDISPGGPLGGLDSERNAFDGADLLYPTQILGDSKEVGKEWRLKIDLLFIDGDHTTDGVIGDIDAWIDHVKRGGIIVFHDYGINDNNKWSNIKVVVDERMIEYRQIGHTKLTGAFKKIKAR